MSEQVEIHPISESSLIIYLGEDSSKLVTHRVQVFQKLILKKLGHLLTDIIPSYHSIHLSFDPLKTDYFALRDLLIESMGSNEGKSIEDDPAKVIEIPVFYSPDVGLDLVDLSEELQLSIQDVVNLHSQQQYFVYAIGFSPGFAYLGDIDQRLRVPRLQTPRTHVPAGSVAIAEHQTAVYPSESPGGWRILGRSPKTLVDYRTDEISAFRVGDKVRFEPISKSEFLSLGGVL